MTNVGKEDVAYTISATDVSGPAIESAIAGTKKVTGAVETMESKMKAQVASIQKHWMGISAAIYAAYAVISKGRDLIEKAATWQEQMQMLDSLAQKYDTTASAIVAEIQKIGEGMISMGMATEVAMAGLAKGMSPDAMYQMAEAAKVLHKVMGVTADEAFAQLSAALEVGKEKTLKMAVGVIDLKDRFGEQVDKMNEAQKAAAMLQLVMEKVREIQSRTSGETKSLADKMEASKARMADLKLEIGTGLIRVLDGLMAAFYGIGAASMAFTSALWKIIEVKQRLQSMVSWGEAEKKHMEAASEAAQNAASDWSASLKLAGQSQEHIELMTASTEELTRATVRHSAAVDQHRVSEGERQKILAETVKALDALGKVVAKYGEEQLKIGKDIFTEKLKEENATIITLDKGLKTYMATLKEVFDTRIAGEKAVSDAMANAGAKPKEQIEAQAAVLKTEREFQIQRAAGWKQYYDALQALHAKSTENMKTKEKELHDLQAAGATSRKSAVEQMLGLQEKLLIAQGKAATDESIYYIKVKANQEAYQAAMKLSGEERVAALESVKKKVGELTNEVTTQSRVFDTSTMKWVEGTRVIVTQEEAIKRAMSDVVFVQEKINAEQKKLEMAKTAEFNAEKERNAGLVAEMGKAKITIDEYRAKISLLSKEIESMDRKIALSVDDKASAPIRSIKALLDQLQDKVINVTVKQTTVPAQISFSRVDPNAIEKNQISAISNAGDFTGSVGNINTISNAGDINGDFSGNFAGAFPSVGGIDGEMGDIGVINVGGDMGGDFGDVGAIVGGGGDYGGGGEYARGAAFDRGNVVPFARGDIITRPTIFPMARGYGLMGEAGPEAVIPLKRGRDGKLGIGSSQTINFNPSITINGSNKSPEQLAREIVRPLKDEMRRLAAVGG